MTSLRRTFAALAVTAAVGGLLVTAVPAHATVADVDEGGQTTRSMIVERALTWTVEKVPYSQTSYWPAGAPSTGVGHSYRQDCSGFLSMAWDLTGSAVTGDFVSTTSAYDTKLASTSLLQPGDMLGTSGHVVLFLGWSADDAGQHRYFDMISEATSGTDASVSTDQDLDGYWSSYTPYVYKHVLADPFAVADWGVGRIDQAYVAADGHIIHRWQLGPASWASEDLTAQLDAPVVRGRVTMASAASHTLDILGTTTSGLLDLHWSGSAWSDALLTSVNSVYGLSAAGIPGRIDVFGRQLDTRPAVDGPGTLVHGVFQNGAFSGWTSVPGTPALADDPDLARGSTVAAYVVVEGSDGSLHLLTWSAAGYVWATGPIVSTAGTPIGGTVTELPDGTTVVTMVSGTKVGWYSTRASGASAWSLWARVPGMNTVTGATSWASAAVLPAANASAPLDVFALTPTNRVAEAQRSASGTWSYVGTA